MMSKNYHAFSVVNYKGGTGKTCTLVNVAHTMAKLNKKVLIIDTDAQGSVSYHLNIEPTKTLYDIIVQNEPAEHCIINARENLDVICANERMLPTENHMHRSPNREIIFKTKLTPVFSNYDYIFLDCSPSMNLINQNAMLCAPDLLVPVSMDYMTLQGVKQLAKNVRLLNKIFNADIRISKVIPTFYTKNNKKTKQVYTELLAMYPEDIATTIRTNVAISEASGLGKTIIEYLPSSSATADYKKLTEEVLKKYE